MAKKFVGNFCGMDVFLDGEIDESAIKLISHLQKEVKLSAQEKEYATNWCIYQLTQLRDEAYQSTWYRDVLKSIKLRLVK